MNLLYLMMALLFPADKVAYTTTVLTIENLDFELGGNLKIQVYDEDLLEAEDVSAVMERTVAIDEGCLPVTLDKLPEGKYMIAVLHDSNSNGKLDFSFFGVPREGYSFSGEFSCKLKSAGPLLHFIELRGGMQQVNVRLCYKKSP